MNKFLIEILPISVVMTFIGTMITIYYTRRNLKTTKYIDTITSERIKWLDTIREEVSNIITNIHFTLKIYSDDIKDRKNEIKNYEVDNEEQMEAEIRYFDAPTSTALGIKKEIWSLSDFVLYLHLFKLRLNPKENIKILDILDYFIKFYLEMENKSSNDILEAKKKVKQLIEQMQELLKQEWEKVKLESRGKISKRVKN